MIRTILIITVVLVSNVAAQIRPEPHRQQKNQLIDQRQIRPKENSEATEFLQQVRVLINERGVAALKPRMAEAVALFLSSGENGLYSAGQSVQLLEGLLGSDKPLGIEFNAVRSSDPHPYAAGNISLLQHGSVKTKRFYISLSRTETGWVISQFNVYD